MSHARAQHLATKQSLPWEAQSLEFSLLLALSYAQHGTQHALHELMTSSHNIDVLTRPQMHAHSVRPDLYLVAVD